MKQIAKFPSAAQADEAAMLLAAHGIVTNVSHKGAKSLGIFIQNDAQVTVWALLDEQLDDARQLLQNPDHEVTSGLSKAQFESFQASAKSGVFNAFNKAIVYGLALILLLLAALMYLST